MDTKLSKSAIRREVKQAKHITPAVLRKKWEDDIFCKLEEQSCFTHARNILLYYPLPDEVSTRDFIEKWKSSKNLYLPVVVGNDLEIKDYNENLAVGSLGVLEPQEGNTVNISEIDMIIVPGMAFDKKKNRLGRGKGYYDRLLKETKGEKIGICFAYQLQEELPTEEHDIAMDMIITPNMVIQ